MGLVDGSLHLYSFSLELAAAAPSRSKKGSGKRGRADADNAGGGGGRERMLAHSLAFTADAHPGGFSCRAVAFAQDGAAVFTGSSDKSICMHDTATGKLVRMHTHAHHMHNSSVYGTHGCKHAFRADAYISS